MNTRGIRKFVEIGVIIILSSVEISAMLLWFIAKGIVKIILFILWLLLMTVLVIPLIVIMIYEAAIRKKEAEDFSFENDEVPAAIMVEKEDGGDEDADSA